MRQVSSSGAMCHLGFLHRIMERAYKRHLGLARRPLSIRPGTKSLRWRLRLVNPMIRQERRFRYWAQMECGDVPAGRLRDPMLQKAEVFMLVYSESVLPMLGMMLQTSAWWTEGFAIRMIFISR